MQFLNNFFKKQEKYFSKNGKLNKLYPLFEVAYTFLFTPGKVTKSGTHIRDFMDLKRLMIMVYIALLPCVIMALYNTGLQANIAISKTGIDSLVGWQYDVLKYFSISFSPNSIIDNIIHGSLYFFPVYLITLMVGGIWETIFAVVRKHEISEGFLVTSLLFPLVLPPDIPYWQVAVGITFGVVIGKEIFGGVGMNIFNPALTGRVFLFFAYPGQITGDKIWVAVDGFSRQTMLGTFADNSIPMNLNFESWMDAFLGFIPGSMGETSFIACLVGAFILIITGVGSWRIMLSVTIGVIFTSSILNLIGSNTNQMFNIPFYWHFVIGSFAFGTVFMATDPVSAANTNSGRWLYGFLIGFLIVLIRVINPAYPEGVMLAILFANVFAPAFDRIFISFNIKRRMKRYGHG